ncbi:MAG: efflux RND transporter periplasmic adaptor subunit [Lachnospiraceae bacterium]|nr:efflux RND transporter periplasmic adaptor subunit [Lachnospiraceae bacterium]
MSRKQQAQLSLDRENLDAQLEAAAQKRKKAKRKKIIIRVVVIAIVLVVLLAIGAGILGVIMSKKSMEQMVNVTHVENGELTQEVKMSGTVQSDNVQHFFAPSALKVESVAEVGTYVKKGEPIIKFDRESYDLALKQLELTDKITENNYQSSVADNNTNIGKLAQAQADVAKYQAEVDEKQKKVDEYDSNNSFDKLQKDVMTQIAMEEGTIAYCEGEIDNLWVAYKIEIGYDTLSQGEAEQAQKNFEARADVIELREKINYSNQVIKNVRGLINDKTESLTEAKTNLAEAKSKLETAKAQVESYKATSGNGYDRENLQLQGELNTLKSGSEYEELQKYKDGCLLAPFDGIITKSYVSEGMTTSVTGSEMIEFSSIEEVSVAVSIGKKDLNKIKEGQKVKVTILDKDYEGEVSKIARVAIAGNGGTTSVSTLIKILDPDESIFLGIEAKNVITTAHEDNCMTLSSESINVDADGYFVYTVNDMNMVEKKPVEVGITTEDKSQILSGIGENDKVVSYVTSVVKEGAIVVPVDEEAGGIMGGVTGGPDLGVTVQMN